MSIPRVGEVIDHYRIDRVVGQGGMGVVFAATDLRLSRTVAIKVITGPLAQDPEFRRRFQEEAAVLARVNSPYVIGIIEHDEHDDLPFIVTQFVDGTELGAWIRDSGPLPARVALAACAQVARGLGDAHRSGVIHRDIKPGNVLVVAPGTPQMHAYLIDFGIARADDSNSNTSIGMVAGTWAYIAPERSKGTPASPASDIYALGCLLWACLTGSTPYVGTDVEMAIAHAQSPIPQLPGNDPFSAELNGVLQRLLAKDPADRYPDGYAVQAALEHLARTAPDAPVERPAGTPAPSMADSTIIRSVEPAKKKRWPLAVAAVAVLALLGGGAVWAAIGANDSDKDPAKNENETSGPAVASDVNGDGKGDLVVHQSRYGALAPLSMWTATSTGTGFAPIERTPASEGTPHLADIDADGEIETVWVNDPDDGVITITSQFSDDTERVDSLRTDSSLNISDLFSATGDLTGDGRDDVVLIGSPSGQADTLYLAVSTGDGFEQPRPIYSSDLSDSIIWIADFDADGTDDLLYWADGDTTATSGEFRLLEPQDEQWTVATVRPLKMPSVNPMFTATWYDADVDADGAAEMITFGAGGRRIFVMELADGKLSDLKAWSRTELTAEEALEHFHNSNIVSQGFADIDADGDADILEIHEPEDPDAALPTLSVWVALSNGKKFEDSHQWSEVPCAGDCEDSFSIVD